MILGKGDTVFFDCGSNVTKSKLITLRPHEAVIVRCACGPNRFFQCLSGKVKRTRVVNVSCNTRVFVACN